MSGQIILTKVFEASEICNIIEACAKSGVETFRAHDIEISFKPRASVPSQEPLFIPPEVERAAESQARESLIRDEVEHKQNELDQLIINDPLAFEELLRSGDLEDEEARPSELDDAL